MKEFWDPDKAKRERYFRNRMPERDKPLKPKHSEDDEKSIQPDDEPSGEPKPDERSPGI